MAFLVKSLLAVTRRHEYLMKETEGVDEERAVVHIELFLVTVERYKPNVYLARRFTWEFIYGLLYLRSPLF